VCPTGRFFASRATRAFNPYVCRFAARTTREETTIGDDVAEGLDVPVRRRAS